MIPEGRQNEIREKCKGRGKEVIVRQAEKGETLLQEADIYFFRGVKYEPSGYNLFENPQTLFLKGETFISKVP